MFVGIMPPSRRLNSMNMISMMSFYFSFHSHFPVACDRRGPALEVDCCVMCQRFGRGRETKSKANQGFPLVRGHHTHTWHKIFICVVHLRTRLYPNGDV